MSHDSTPPGKPPSEDAFPYRRHPRRLRFRLESTTYESLRVLQHRGPGEVILLAERRLPHGLTGLVTLRRLRNPVSFERCQRLLEEVQLSFRLSHPVIARVHHLKILGDRPCLISEHVDGPSLDTLLNLAVMGGKPLSTPFALHLAAELADALHHAHTLTDAEQRPLGIIHRDVSPRNVRVARTGEVKLTDFGAAYSRRVGREETPGLLLKGDVAYASPEYLHRLPMDGRSDVFSLGLVLLEMLTSRHLFDLGDVDDPEAAQGVTPEEKPSVPLSRMMTLVHHYGPEDVRRAVEGLPDAVQALLQKALQRKPSARHATAAELRDALRAALATQAPRFGRQEVVEELARLTSEASVLRDRVELDEEGVFPSDLDVVHTTPDPDTR